MEQIVGSGKGLVVVQAHLVQQLLRLQDEGAWSGCARDGGSIKSRGSVGAGLGWLGWLGWLELGLVVWLVVWLAVQLPPLCRTGFHLESGDDEGRFTRGTSCSKIVVA